MEISEWGKDSTKHIQRDWPNRSLPVASRMSTGATMENPGLCTNHGMFSMLLHKCSNTTPLTFAPVNVHAMVALNYLVGLNEMEVFPMDSEPMFKVSAFLFTPGAEFICRKAKRTPKTWLGNCQRCCFPHFGSWGTFLESVGHSGKQEAGLRWIFGQIKQGSSYGHKMSLSVVDSHDSYMKPQCSGAISSIPVAGD